MSEMSRQGGKLITSIEEKKRGRRKKRNKEPADCMIIHCLRKTGWDYTILWGNST